jgi:hexosaminidase
MARPSILPAPRHHETRTGSFEIKRDVRVLVSKHRDVASVAIDLANRLERALRQRPPVAPLEEETDTERAIVLRWVDDPQLGDEGYRLDVTPEKVVLEGKGPGLAHGVQTMRQLMPPEFEAITDPHGQGLAKKTRRAWRVPAGRIEDWPRFRWRGLLLDSARHFQDVEFIKRTIDLLAHYKMNRFHWHLTDDQGWRVQIRKHPRLTTTGAWRKLEDGSKVGGFYSQSDIRQVVEYAAIRNVIVVPEIEMPGHCRAALAAYPDHSCTRERMDVETQWGVFEDVFCAGANTTLEFLENILTEVIELFPGPYVHIGGDEVPKTRWQNCSRCQKRIKEEGLKNEDELQSWFLRRVGEFLHAHGRQLVGWDEILAGGLPPRAIVQSWRNLEGAVEATRAGHDTIASPISHVYLDQDLSKVDTEKVYAFEPIPEGLNEEEAGHILGGECNLWTERAPQERVHRKLFPRMLAMAERLWSTSEHGDYGKFHARLQKHYPRLEALGVEYGPETSGSE